MELSKYIACICEGTAERVSIDRTVFKKGIYRADNYFENT